MFGRGRAVLRSDGGHTLLVTAPEATLDGLLLRTKGKFIAALITAGGYVLDYSMQGLYAVGLAKGSFVCPFG